MQSVVRRSVAALTLSTALIGSSAALAAPANAAKWTYDDAVGDVVKQSLEDGTTTPAPEKANVDVTRIVGNHHGRFLTIKVRTKAKMTGPLGATSMIRTPRKRLMLMTSRMPQMGNQTMLLDFTKKRDPEVRCRGLARTFDKSRTVMTIKVPRSCIGNPEWVRFSMTLSTVDMFSEDFITYDDDALREGVSQYSMGKMSPKLRHG
ncbi:hypothetical protein GCM10022237_16380 [Nocardioides ginsengisoli]|uniref:Uncharacterized protein n=1 Tax=Nocardioides ginsengisoli TaxID=363868 RepID=A0ABW3W624_9ACTN